MKSTSEHAERVRHFENTPGSGLRVRHFTAEPDTAVRLAAAGQALRSSVWAERNADAVRATVLELAALDDAMTSACAALPIGPALPATAAYLRRAADFLGRAIDAVMVAAFDPATDVRERLSDAIEVWEPQVPWEVVFEIAELADGEVHARIFEASAAWDRAARGLVRRLMLGFTAA